jgi:DNA helicase-4
VQHARVRRQEPERQAVAQRNRRANELRQGLWAAFETRFLTADDVLADDPDRDRLSIDEYRALKAEFVQKWAARELGQPLDSEQALAVATFGGDARVIARAGSGKTRTLVTRAIFLVKHCRLEPRAVLLLAFNRRAADEMHARLKEHLGARLPHVMTFHALALRARSPGGDDPAR